jgi:hypothetical protein
MRQNVSVYEVEEKVTQKGNPFWSAKTNKGNMSIFDQDVAFEIMQKGTGKICDLETETKGKYTNIMAFNGTYGSAEEDKPKDFTRNQESKDASMMVSYAKDIVLAVINRIPSTEKISVGEIDKMMEETAKSVSKAYKIIKEAIKI